jgi:hypothetical protein
MADMKTIKRKTLYITLMFYGTSVINDVTQPILVAAPKVTRY